MSIRRLIVVAALAAATMAPSATARPTTVTTTTTVPTTRLATADEHGFCEANYDRFGPITGDCAIVPLAGTIEEDDPWGRWDCVRQGNHVCNTPDGLVIFFNTYTGWEGFYLDAPDRPGCFMEPSNTPDGWEIIFYPDMGSRTESLGFEVRCPTNGRTN